jgi:hypothetical protein
MKGKITIVLFSLVLVFGMIAVSCDDGAFSDKDGNDKTTYFAYENVEDDLPVKKLDESPKLMKSADVYAELQKVTIWPVGSTTVVPLKVLDTVKMKTKWAALPGEDAETEPGKTKKLKRDIATKYAGMQILVSNPVFDTAP